MWDGNGVMWKQNLNLGIEGKSPCNREISCAEEKNWAEVLE